MPTHNLYEIPDVCATLLIAIAERNGKLVAHTTNELTQSGLNPLPTLLLGWFLSPPQPETSKACYLAFLSTNIKNVLNALHTLQAYDLPPLSPMPPPCPSYGKTEKAVSYAVKHHNFRHAAYLTSALLGSVKDIRCILKHFGVDDRFINLLETTEFQPLHIRILLHLFAALAYEGTSAVLSNSYPVEKGRSFKVNPTLYSIWGIRPLPPSRLLGLPLHIMEENAAPYWKKEAEKFQITLKDNELHFPDDAALERFYLENFPNDIPDEWSALERAKSHPYPTVVPCDNVWFAAFSFTNPLRVPF